MLFKGQGILQFISQSSLSFNSVLFFLSLFPVDNTGQSYGLTHCIKKSTLLQSKIINIKAPFTFHTYVQKYYAKFEGIFFVSKLLTNAISLPFNLFLLDFPHHTRAKVKSPAWEGLTNSTLPEHRK